MLIEYLNFIKSQELFPAIRIFVFAIVCALALLGLVDDATKVDTGSENRAKFGIDLHCANNYGTFYRKVKNYLRYP